MAKTELTPSSEILVNTPRALESPVLSALRQALCLTEVYSAGPLAGGGLHQVCELVSVKLWFQCKGSILGC